jgi:multidrug efflux pump subunit AcrA (membrane-fusion protein)
MGETSYTWDIDGTGEENTLKLVIKYDKTQEDSSDSNSNKNENAAGSGTTGSNNGGSDGSKEATGSTTGGQSGVASSGNSSGTVSGGASSGSTGSVSSTTGSTSSDQGTSSSSDISSSYESVAFTIAKQDNAMLVVNVDELDILSVEEGQTASITLDALEDETFEGTVTRVAQTASSGNGSTKYEVEITVPMDDNMRIGMSASATIQVSEAEDTLTIPMTALQQRGDETFVYTTEEDGTLSGEVTVETGLSDGTNVEITSGLEEGDTVYYTRTSGGESDSSDMQNDFMQGMGGMNGNDGGFGGDGNMPSGGSDGNGPGGDAPGGNSGGGPGNSGE